MPAVLVIALAEGGGPAWHDRLEDRGLEVRRVARDGALAAALDDPELVAVIVLARGADPEAVELVGRSRAQVPRCRVAFVAAPADLETAVAVLKRGAVDYRVAPLDERALDELVASLRPEPPRRPEIIGACPEMESVARLIGRVAAVDSPVLISGESGTGKELVARAIHRESARARAPFVAVNCGALSGGLLDSELFGHVRGAFTGAGGARRGLFEEADGGIIFLDEIASAAIGSQVKLLRVLEDGEVRPIGSSTTVATDVRVIAATAVDLAREVQAGRFRDDLYYRLDVVDIRLPALRARPGDVELLARHFAGRAAAAAGAPPPRYTTATLAALRAHSWPGNVRELRNVMERAVLLAGGDALGPEHLPEELVEAGGHGPLELEPYAEAKRLAVRRFQREYILSLLDRCGGNVSAAARAAELPRQTLHRLLREISPTSDPSAHGDT